MNPTLENGNDLPAVASDSSPIDSDVQQQQQRAEENPTFCDQDFDDDDESDDEDWAADGANHDDDGSSSSGESESSNYELIAPAGIPEEDDNEEFEYRKCFFY